MTDFPTSPESAILDAAKRMQSFNALTQLVTIPWDDIDPQERNHWIGLACATLRGDLAQRPADRAAIIEECAKVAESYPSSGEQTEHPVEYWIRRLSHSSTDRLTETDDGPKPVCIRCGAHVHSPCETDAQEDRCELPPGTSVSSIERDNKC